MTMSQLPYYRFEVVLPPQSKGGSRGFPQESLIAGIRYLPFGLDIQPLSPLPWQLDGCSKYFNVLDGIIEV